MSHRPLPARGSVRKDLRRPRFSFFRFSCQTAAYLSEGLTPFGGRTGFPDPKIGWQRGPKKLRKTTCRSCSKQPRRRWSVYRSARAGLSTRIYKIVASHANRPDSLGSRHAPRARASVGAPNTYGKHAAFAPPSAGLFFARRSGPACDPVRADEPECSSFSPADITLANAGFGRAIVLGPTRRHRRYRR